MPWCCCCAGGAPIYSVGARPQAAKSNREAQLQLQRCRVASAPAASRMPSAPSTLLYTVRYTSHTAVCARRAWTYRHTNRTVMRLIYSPCAAAAPVHRARASTCGTDDGRAGVSAVAAAAKSESEPRPRGEAAWDAVGEPGLQRTQHAGSLSRAGLRAQLV